VTGQVDLARRPLVVIDPIGAIDPRKDSTLALLLEAQRWEWSVHTWRRERKD